MENIFIRKFRGLLTINISGKHIERLIKRIHQNQIELLEINYNSHNDVNIKIYKEDFNKIEEIKTIYDIYIVDSYGIYKIKKLIKKNRFLILGLILGLILLFLLSNTIFEVRVIHNDKNLRNLILNALDDRGIKKYNFKKNYHSIQKIKEDIIKEYKEQIEWLEIENIGTKYIIRVEERKMPNKSEEGEKQNVIATKNAIIKKIEASSGEIVKNKGDYVKPGDVIISGEIKLYDNIKDIVKADGKIYGEVWYQIKVEHPFSYKEERETGKTKKVLSLKFLNTSFDIFNFNPFKNKKTEAKNLLKNNLIPISLVWENQKELKIIDEVYTEEQAINKAMELATKKIEENLDDDEYIIKQNNLKISLKESKIEVDIFFAVYENITGYQKIEMELPEIEN